MRRSSNRIRRSRFGFPVSPEVTDVHFHNIRYVGLSKGKNYETVILEFRRGSKYLVDLNYFQEELSYPDYDKYASATAAKKLKLERLGHVFLTRKEMARINAESKGIDEYVESLKKLMLQKDCKKNKLVLKTVRDKKGFICLPSFGDYIKLESSEKSFEYDSYEKSNIEDFKN